MRARHTCTLNTSPLQPPTPPLNSCHCCVNGEICYNAHTGQGNRAVWTHSKDHCKNVPYHIYTRVIQQNDLIHQNAGRISKPLTLNSTSIPDA